MCLWAELCVVFCACALPVYMRLFYVGEKVFCMIKKREKENRKRKKGESVRESHFHFLRIIYIPFHHSIQISRSQFSSLTYSEYVVVKATGMELVEGLLTLYIYRIYQSKYNWKKPIYMFFLTLASVPKISNERKTPAQIKNWNIRFH